MILCCGEALIDMVPSTSVDGDACFVPKAGGAVFNTAIALGRLGADVGLFTGMSDDLFGQLLQGELTASHVQTSHIVVRRAPSSLAFVELDNGQAHYTFYTENAADKSLTQSDIPTNLTNVDAVFFGGISLCSDPTASTLQALMRAKVDACVTMIDPNIRPAFITNEASYRARLDDMIGISDILKISDEDLNWLVPNANGIPTQLAGLARDEKLTFVTKGAEGAEAYLGTTKIAAAAGKSVKVVDTIGAGDTFNAGILRAFQHNGALNKMAVSKPDTKIVQAALDLSVATSAVTVSRRGANPPWSDELNE